MNETIIIRAPIGASWESREVALAVARKFAVECMDQRPGVPMPYGVGVKVTHHAHWTKRRAIVVTVLEAKP